MAFQPFDYGSAVNKGNQNALNQMQIRDYAQSLPAKKAQYNQEQLVNNTKHLYMATSEMLQNPQSAARHMPELQQMGIIDPKLNWQQELQTNPQGFMANLKKINDGAKAAQPGNQ